MELKIYSPQDAGFIQKIDWNFEELKTEISAVAQEYETSVYTDDTISDAKADRAKLNKFQGCPDRQAYRNPQEAPGAGRALRAAGEGADRDRTEGH